MWSCILSQHDCNCATCIRSGNCPLQKLANDLNIHEHALPDPCCARGIRTPPSPLVREASKCIKCMRCVQVCDKIQSLGIWDVAGTGSRTTVDVSGNRTPEDLGLHLLRPVRHPLSHRRPARPGTTR